VPVVLAWEPEGPYEIEMSVFNAANMSFTMVQAQAEASAVTVYRLDGTIACQTPEPVQKVYKIYAVAVLAPGSHWEVRRDLRQDCGALSSGVYSYEASYRANDAEQSGLYRAFLGPLGGRVLVRAGASSMTYEDMLAALDGTKATDPRDAGPDAAAGEPATASAPEPSPSVAEIHACVDKELHDRGLNAYGDPEGTVYANGTPPVDALGRILYVASRNAAIHRACKIPMF
jgi:hypothetical protein